MRPTHGHADERWGMHYVSDMSDEQRAEVFDQLRRVIAWEVGSQLGVERPVDQMPPLIADTLLDYFDVSLKTGADISGLG
jgi:hypothetical protein